MRSVTRSSAAGCRSRPSSTIQRSTPSRTSSRSSRPERAFRSRTCNSRPTSARSSSSSRRLRTRHRACSSSWRRDGRILNQNRATLAASGLAAEDDLAVSYFWDVFIDERSATRCRRAFHEAAPDFPPLVYENDVHERGGRAPGDRVGERTVADAAGRVTSIVAGGIDITERKQREVQLQRERDITDTLMQAIPSLVVVVDNDGLIVDGGVRRDAGRRQQRVPRALSAGPTSELVRRSVLDLIDPADAYAASMTIAAAANGVAMPEQRVAAGCAHDGGAHRRRLDRDADRRRHRSHGVARSALRAST